MRGCFDKNERAASARTARGAMIAMTVAFASPAAAERVFFDDFNGEAGGGTAIFQTTLGNWDVNGYVDVIGMDNRLGYTVDSTMIDLGGGLTGGFIKTKQKFSYAAGELVTISWDMSGNQIRPQGEDVPYLQFYFDQINEEQYQQVRFIRGTEFFDFVNFDDSEFGELRIYDFFFAYGYGLYGDYPIRRQSISFLPVLGGAFHFELGTYSGGGYGPLIDNFAVDITAAAVPEPASWAMLIAGFAMAGAAARRRRAPVTVLA